MKKTLLNSAGYAGFDNVKFPVEVEAHHSATDYGYYVYPPELNRITGGKHVLPLFFIPGVEIV